LKDKNFDFKAPAHVKEELENGLKDTSPAFKGNTECSIFASGTAEPLRLYISDHEEDTAEPNQAHYYSG